MHEADIHDKEGGRLLLEEIGEQQFPRMKKLWTDQGYAGLSDWVDEKFGWNLEVVSQPKTELVPIIGDDGEPKEVPIKVKGFQVIPRRWVVERTFAWCSRNRRLSKDYEQLPETEEAFFEIAMITILLHRFRNSG